MKMQFELTREGASALAAQQSRLIEPLPRTISHDVVWLLNTVTGYLELNCDLIRELGDTIYREYEPTRDELDRLRAGQRVRAKLPMGLQERMALAAPAPSSDVLRQRAMEVATGPVDVFSRADDMPTPIPPEVDAAALAASLAQSQSAANARLRARA